MNSEALEGHLDLLLLAAANRWSEVNGRRRVYQVTAKEQRELAERSKSVARLQPRDLRGREGVGVSSPSVDPCVVRLSRALQREGFLDPRIVDLTC